MVYIDAIQTWPNVKGQAARYGSRWCHMTADTVEELHAFAKKIGMQRSWFQDKPRHFHYDLVPSRRALAVAAGAVELDIRAYAEMVYARRKLRQLHNETDSNEATDSAGGAQVD